MVATRHDMDSMWYWSHFGAVYSGIVFVGCRSRNFLRAATCSIHDQWRGQTEKTMDYLKITEIFFENVSSEHDGWLLKNPLLLGNSEHNRCNWSAPRSMNICTCPWSVNAPHAITQSPHACTTPC